MTDLAEQIAERWAQRIAHDDVPSNPAPPEGMRREIASTLLDAGLREMVEAGEDLSSLVTAISTPSVLHPRSKRWINALATAAGKAEQEV